MPADRLVLVRHGRTASNAAGRWQGRTDIPLDDEGHRQAASAARALPVEETGVTRLVSSDLSRAVATAAPIAAALGVPAEQDPRLQEVFAGEWEGLNKTEIGERWGDAYHQWEAGHDVRLGGGERISEASTRVADAVNDLARSTESGTLVIVAHGGVLRGATQLLLGLQFGQLPLAVLRNGSWGVLFVGRDGGWRLESWNVAG